VANLEPIRLKFQRLPVLDSLIAARAVAHGLTLATTSAADYPPEIPVINPWKGGEEDIRANATLATLYRRCLHRLASHFAK